MLPTRLLLGLLAAAVALTAAAPAGAAAKKPWQAKWQFVDVDLDGTTTASYAEGDRSYVVDGAMSYDSYRPGGFMDLRPAKAVSPGVFVAKAAPVELYTASRATYRDRDRTVDCSTAPSRSKVEALAAIVQVTGSTAKVQWSIAPTTQECDEPIEQLSSTPLPAEAMTSTHRLGSGRTMRLRVDIDETVRESSGSLRVQWKGTVTLKRR